MPATANVITGQTVKWQWNDGASHNVVQTQSDKKTPIAGGFSSGNPTTVSQEDSNVWT